MKKVKEHLTLYLILDDLKEELCMEAIGASIEAGVTLLELRGNPEMGKCLKEITGENNIPFIISDDLDLVKELDADGIHIGYDLDLLKETRKALGKDKIIGVACRTVKEALEAEENTADYLSLDEISSQEDLEAIREVTKNTGIPVVAMTGADQAKISQLRDTNMSGIALSSKDIDPENLREELSQLHRLSREVFYGGRSI